MITKKQRNFIIIVVAIIIILIVSSVLGIIYIKTDFLKANNVLFAKYISQNIETLEGILDLGTEEKCADLLKQNNYEYNSKLTAEYIENYDTNSEQKDDLMNDISLDIYGKVNNLDNIKYSNIKVNDNNNEIIGLEYIYQNNNMYSLKFSNIFKQYISIENSNLKG